MNQLKPRSKQPLPPNATKVFEGVIFDVYQWQQVLYDGTTTTFEKISRPDTVVVFPILPNEQILLTKQEQPGKEPFIGATGGRVERGEDVLSAASRELLEETGYKAGEYQLWKAIQPISKIEWSVYIFIARNLSQVTTPNLDSGEKIELFPVNFDSFIEIALQPNFYEQEVFRDVVEAKLHPEKKAQLRQLFFGKK